MTGGFITDEHGTEYSLDDIHIAVQAALSQLDGKMLTAISALTGLSPEKLTELEMDWNEQ